MVLVKGAIEPGKPTLVRMHALSIFADIFAEENDRQGLLQGAMRAIGEEGSGIVVLINRPARDYGSRAIRMRADANIRAMAYQQREYGVGAQILAELGVHDMILLTNSKQSLVGLEGYDLSIVDTQTIPQGCSGGGN